MNRISNIKQAILGERESSTDTNKLYSILLDTQASTTSDNIYDITEKLLNNEKNSAKIALEQLWTLKKNLDESEQGTVDILINFYQEKLDILRSKEKHINKVSKDSRELLQEKRNRDTEIAIVTQEIEECKNEIDRLSNKMKELKVKVQELILIENQT